METAAFEYLDSLGWPAAAAAVFRYGWVAVAAVISGYGWLAIPAAVFGYIYRSLMGDRGNANRAFLREILTRQPLRARYKSLARALEDGLNRLYGPAYTFRAFAVCVAIAVFYPSLFFYASYATGGLYALVGIPLFPPDSPVLWGQVSGQIAFLLVEAIILFRHDQIDCWARRWLQHRAFMHGVFGLVVGTGTAALMAAVHLTMGSYADWSMTLSIALVTAIGISVTVRHFALAAACASLVLLCGVAAVGLAVAVAWAMAVCFASAGRVSAALTIAVATIAGGSGTVAVADMGLVQESGTLDERAVSGFLLLVVLPTINGLFDWVSWRISRFFIRRAQHAAHWSGPATDMALDMAASVLFMMGLVLTLPPVVELVAQLPAHTLKIEWRPLARIAREEPWTRGLVVTLMLLTTLVPTVLHVICGHFALIAHLAPGRRLLSLLDRIDDETLPSFGNQYEHAMAATVITGFLVVSVAFVCASLWVCLWIAEHPISEWLYQVAVYRPGVQWLVLIPILFFLGTARLPMPPRSRT